MSDVNVSSAVSQADATVQPSAQPGATPQAPAAPAAAATPTQQPSQTPATGVPEGYIPSYVLKQRLDEARGAAVRQAQQEWAQREAEIRGEAERYKQQLQALVGVTPQGDPEVEAIRQQFGKLYPGLSKLEERTAQLEDLLERAGNLEQQNQHYWASYGRQSVDRLFSKASEAFGSPLTEEAKSALHSSFVGFVQSSPEMESRYANDPTIIDDFIKMFTSSFIDPVRRVSTATVQGRAAAVQGLPQDTPSGVPNPSQPPKLNGLDERAAAGWALWQHNKNQG